MWLPFGGAHAITGSAASEQRFPGQWFQIEAGLHYNWHRHYDASLGRYTQPDPLGFVDGPSVYAYARNNPQMYVDPRGLDVAICTKPIDYLGPLGPALSKYGVEHAWVKTDTKEAGMWGAGTAYDSYAYTYNKVQVDETAHQGLSQRGDATCTKVEDVDEDCVNRLLQHGRSLGRWSFSNECRGFAKRVIEACKKKK